MFVFSFPLFLFLQPLTQFQKGKRDPRAGILVGNHISVFDPFIVNSDEVVAPVNKKEFLKLPLAGTILRAIEVFFFFDFFDL